MLYGTAVRSPAKRRFLGSMTPCKTRKVKILKELDFSLYHAYIFNALYVHAYKF